MYVVFHKAMPKDITVQVLCEVKAVGKKMATLSATTLSPDGATVYASCVHEKFAFRALKI